MRALLKFPLIYVLELASWVLLVSSFASVVSFSAAKPIAELIRLGAAVQPSWEAAVQNHGKFYQWYLIANHPVAFGASLCALVGGAVTTIAIQRAALNIRRAEGAPGAKRHEIARACIVFAPMIAATIYLSHMF